MSYIDGFLIPVPATNKDAYITTSKKMTAFFERHGAVRIVECWGNDVFDGKIVDFKRAVAAREGESIVFSWIEWPSKDVRDRANRAMREDVELMDVDMPFDGKRMVFGGFDVLLDFKSKQP